MLKLNFYTLGVILTTLLNRFLDVKFLVTLAKIWFFLWRKAPKFFGAELGSFEHFGESNTPKKNWG